MRKCFQLIVSIKFVQFCLCQQSIISRHYSTMAVSVFHNKKNLLEEFTNVVPPLAFNFHKGQAGRVAVIGGSEEYTGAPYFAAITALKVGADLSHVICAQSASPVIKSYSPELIVHPLLDKEDSMETIKHWLSRFHAVVIGPGLGRDPSIVKTVGKLIEFLRSRDTPVVIDADGLFIVTENPNIIQGYKKAILTPNVVEFNRLYTAMNLNSNDENHKSNHVSETIALSRALGDVTIVRKGSVDVIAKGDQVALVEEKGSPRRCGGQGDLLSGAMNVFAFWAYRSNDTSPSKIDPSITAGYAACLLTRRCAAQAFSKHGRSTITTNLIEEIQTVFQESKL